MAAVVATMVVGPLVKIVMEKASGSILGQYKVMKGMEEQQEILMRKLPAILDIITDAEQAAAHREGAAAWLRAIKKVAYEANEVFDEFKYEALRRKAKKEGHYKELGFHVVKLFPTHNRYVFRNRMGRKLRKIVLAIEVLVTEMNAFGFKYQQQPPSSTQLRQTGHGIFDPEKITSRSRAEDNKNIVDILVGQAKNTNLTVVPIVGMGGLGKTTLAQLVYNDPEIQKHFNLLLWVCVSDSFDVDSLAKSIAEAAHRKMDDGIASTKTPLDILQNVVSRQRYLLVLDDVWTREVHKWQQLKGCLEHGSTGSVVLTTTRDKGVAEMMGTVEEYDLRPLEDSFIKEIIETRAFSRLHKEEERPAVLVNMVGKMVERCVGSPLAATALGSVLCTKTSEEEWKAILSRGNICTEESGILPILKLSYNELPSHMKQCFAFCAIFPKDYEIDVEKLIQLWIAHGFIIHEKQVCLELVGKQIFNELASRSFFQDVEQVQATAYEVDYEGACNSRITCKIHDLMHDVALSVMEKECALATEERGKTGVVVGKEESSQSDWLPNTARHLFLSCNRPDIFLNNFLEKGSPAIQTLLCDHYMRSLEHLSKYSSLQALRLRPRKSSFVLKPTHLHHLRYLDLSNSYIKALPEDMSILYSLQTLNLSGCEYLARLPRQMKYMTALRQLYTHGCPNLESMPRDIGKLTSLRTLTCFVAGSGSNCSNVGEIRNLNLGGQLELHQLENVKAEHAEAANLMKKKELRDLTLKWISGSDDSVEETSGEDDASVLDKLKPHDGLHAIRISSYRATTFPTWMTMLQNIVEINLTDCKKLRWVFSHDCDTSFAFPNLKELALQDLVCLERWSEIDNDVTEGEEIMFPRLEKLFISHCEKLTALPGQLIFPNLQNVDIMKSPEMTTVAKSPKLSVLKMEGHAAELLQWMASHMTSLTHLQLTSLENSTETTSAAAEHGLREVVDCREKWNGDFPLTVLVLRNFNSGVTELCACFVDLQDLTIANCDALVHWPEKEFQGLVSLRNLRIWKCKNLTGYAQAPAEPSTSSETRQLLPRLETLEIWRCASLVEVFNVPASLKKMDISWSSKLESLQKHPSFRRLQQGQSASSIYHGPSSVPEVSSPLSPGTVADHLEKLILVGCESLTGVLRIPASLKKLHMQQCHGLTSLESHSGGLLSLERLFVLTCKSLSSLPDGPQAYSSLQYLTINNCPGMKTLPTSLRQQLGSIQSEDMDAHYYGKPMLLKPKTWKYVCKG